MPKKLDLRKLLTYKLVLLSREISNYNQRNTNPTKDIKIPQLRVLSLLYSVGKCSQTEFVQTTLRGDPGNMSRYINSLISKGYIKAANDKKDRRVKWLTLTQKGIQIAKIYTKERSLHNESLSTVFTNAEITQLEKLLDKATSYYHKQNYQ
jgi:DNA-binding MarR family transcriptional regulator